MTLDYKITHTFRIRYSINMQYFQFKIFVIHVTVVIVEAHRPADYQINVKILNQYKNLWCICVTWCCRKIVLLSSGFFVQLDKKGNG